MPLYHCLNRQYFLSAILLVSYYSIVSIFYTQRNGYVKLNFMNVDSIYQELHPLPKCGPTYRGLRDMDILSNVIRTH